MTGTREFHQQLLQEFTLEQRVSLTGWPCARVELFLLRRRKRHLAFELVSAESPLVCDFCGNNSTSLRQCPWTRQLRFCSQTCYDGGQVQYAATLVACFC